MPKNYNIAIIGMGTIGELVLSKFCEQLLQNKIVSDNINSIICLSTNVERLESKISDIKQSLLIKIMMTGNEAKNILPYLDKIKFSTQYQALKNVDYIITSYSVPMDENIKERTDLLKKNDLLTQSIAEQILLYAPKTCCILNIVNPLDVITMRLQQLSGLPVDQVVGISGLIDCTRLAQALHEILAVPYQEIDFSSLMVCGEHGPSMLPLLSQVKIGNKNLVLNDHLINKIERFTRQKGTEMMKSNRGMPPHVVTAEAVCQCLFAWMGQQEKALCLSVWHDEYQCYLGNQVVIAGNGMKRTNILSSINAYEKEKLNISVKIIQYYAAQL